MKLKNRENYLKQLTFMLAVFVFVATVGVTNSFAQNPLKDLMKKVKQISEAATNPSDSQSKPNNSVEEAKFNDKILFMGCAPKHPSPSPTSTKANPRDKDMKDTLEIIDTMNKPSSPKPSPTPTADRSPSSDGKSMGDKGGMNSGDKGGGSNNGGDKFDKGGRNN